VCGDKHLRRTTWVDYSVFDIVCMEPFSRSWCSMNAYMASAIINVALMILIGFAVWATKSAWPLLGLLLMVSVECEKEPLISVRNNKEAKTND